MGDNEEADLKEPDREISWYEQEPTGKVEAHTVMMYKGFGYRKSNC